MHGFPSWVVSAWRTERRRLLEAADWNRYVASKSGCVRAKAALKVNREKLVQLRRERLGGLELDLMTSATLAG